MPGRSGAAGRGQRGADKRVRESRGSPKADDLVFLNRHRRPCRDVRKAWAEAIEAAGLANRPDLTFHALRHTFATHFLEGGGAVTDLQAQLGHSKLATTQVYAAMVNERRRATVLALDYDALTAAPKNEAERSDSKSNSTAAEGQDGGAENGAKEAGRAAS